MTNSARVGRDCETALALRECLSLLMGRFDGHGRSKRFHVKRRETPSRVSRPVLRCNPRPDRFHVKQTRTASRPPCRLVRWSGLEARGERGGAGSDCFHVERAWMLNGGRVPTPFPEPACVPTGMTSQAAPTTDATADRRPRTNAAIIQGSDRGYDPHGLFHVKLRATPPPLRGCSIQRVTRFRFHVKRSTKRSARHRSVPFPRETHP